MTGTTTAIGVSILKSLADIDALLTKWASIVAEENKPFFEKLRKDAANFRAFRTETARLGIEVSPQAANEQGNNEANRANRKAFQESIDALTKRNSEAANLIEHRVDSLYEQRLILLASITLGGVLSALLIGGFVGHRQIARPLQMAIAAIQKLASGDYRLPSVRETRDELGEIWKSMRVFADAMSEAERLRAAQADTEKEIAARRKAEMMELAQNFEGSVGALVQHVSAAAQEMEATARSMAATAEQTNQ